MPIRRGEPMRPPAFPADRHAHRTTAPATPSRRTSKTCGIIGQGDSVFQCSRAFGFVHPGVVATVNTRRITRDDLARDCLRHFGKEVLESMVNKQLIMRECRQRGITVTRSEVNAEIEGMARRFKIPVDQWLKMLKQERNVSPEQYANDIIWPTIALRKLAGDQLSVSEQELRTEFDMQYGEQIRVRLIATRDLQKRRICGRKRGQSAQFRQPRQREVGRHRQREREGSD